MRNCPTTIKPVLHEPTDMGDKEWSPANILDLFGDSIARAILILANTDPVAVNEIAERLDVSNPTVYRRIDPLVDANLLEEKRQIDQDGNQHKVYKTILDEVTFKIEGDSYTVDTQINQDLADDFESMWSDLESTNRSGGTVDRPNPSDVKTRRGDPS